MHVFSTTEIAAALLQAAIAAGLAGLFLFLHRKYGKPHFLWWAVAWGMFTLRLGAIISFLASDTWGWLFWHQVATGWTALALLWAALVFSRQVRWRPAYALWLLFPLVWSHIAIFRLSDFMLAAGPAVLFLSVTTGWTGVVFWQYRRRTGSAAARMLAITFLLWALHHLDYPLLRARGTWNPWGYYLDTLFLLAVGAGILLLVIEEMRQGLFTLSALSGDLRRPEDQDSLDALLGRPLALRGVRGAALVEPGARDPIVLRGVGDCATWAPGQAPPGPVSDAAREVLHSGTPLLRGTPRPTADMPPFMAVLPLGGTRSPRRALVVLGEVAAPFTALDDGILSAVGAQIGTALEAAALYHALEQRTGDLERLSVRMIQQHEEQRRRLSRELHDETAQVFSALKLQVGALREAAPAGLAARFAHLLDLVGAGTRSIRNVTEGLRPALLDDLGLLPALRALVADSREWSGLDVRLEAPETLPLLPAEADLALFRAVQEGISNAASHAQARTVAVRVTCDTDAVHVTVEDDGQGLTPASLARVTNGPGRSGLFGMRERIGAQGGTVRIVASPGRGVRLELEIPVQGEDAP